MTTTKKSALLILDGWGISPIKEVSAIANGETPYYDRLLKDFPSATLLTDGLSVGLPDGQMGNSEVGHMNIGAGRVVFQDLVKINKSIEDKSFYELEILLEAFKKAKTTGQTVHIIGLISDGGVHSHIEHLKALIEMIIGQELKNVFIHAITDGRDCDPKSAYNHISVIQKAISDSNIEIASLIGRYYAMDRDKRWERIKKSYDLMCNGVGDKTTNILDAIQESYDNNITDEFIDPIVCTDNKDAKIKDGDLVIFFNYRADRPRELTEVLSQVVISDYDMEPFDLDYITFTEYQNDYKNIKVLFRKEKPKNTLGEFLSNEGKTQLRIAETEKYAHVTYFFSGGIEKEFEGEHRILAPSPKVATYDLKPEMSAYDITKNVKSDIVDSEPDFICLNFANADMVGHTGDFEAAKLAVNTVDKCLEDLVPLLLKHNYETIIIADHGNSDNMINPDGSPNTQHSLNPVPIIYVSNDANKRKIESGILADVAPTLIHLMGLTPPKEMTGKVLVENKRE